MSLHTLLETFASRAQSDPSISAEWYTVAASAIAAASGGPDVPKLYRFVTDGLEKGERMAIQRRLKEAILKTSPLYGIPRSLQALFPLFNVLPEDEIDHFGPRYDALNVWWNTWLPIVLRRSRWESRGSKEAAQARKEKARAYFDTLWTPVAAQANRDQLFKYQPDLYLMNLESAYEWYISEDAILNNVQTQMCNVAALICSNCPVQAVWHTKGLIRHGGSMDMARFAHDLGLSIAELYGCKTGNVTPVDEIDFADERPH